MFGAMLHLRKLPFFFRTALSQIRLRQEYIVSYFLHPTEVNVVSINHKPVQVHDHPIYTLSCVCLCTWKWLTAKTRSRFATVTSLQARSARPTVVASSELLLTLITNEVVCLISAVRKEYYRENATPLQVGLMVSSRKGRRSEFSRYQYLFIPHAPASAWLGCTQAVFVASWASLLEWSLLIYYSNSR